MAIYNFTCPYCRKMSQIQNYALGFLDALELRCDNCPTTLWVGLYDPKMTKFYEEFGIDYSRQDDRMKAIEEALKPCDCGGSFHHLSAYRCNLCHHEMTLEEIIRQIGWRGAPNGKPGIAMGKIIDGDQTNGQIWKD